MLKRRIVSIATMLCMTTLVYAQGDYATRAKNYIEQYKAMAIAEQKRSGIPAAITLAQGIHETSAGASELATNANNHFGIKCKRNWTGETYAHTDDAPDECFRKYGSAIESYKDHSDYLSTTPRYASLFKLSPTDYASWAIGLKKAGYATNPRYAQVLIKLIEDFRLQEYTYAAMDNGILDNKYVGEVVPESDAVPVAEEPWAKQANAKSGIRVAELPSEADEAKVATLQAETQAAFPPYGQPVKVNGLKAVYAKKGDMPLEYAITHNVRYERLLEINEIADRPLEEDMYLYLERKRFKGIRPTHQVKPGETLASIARYEGVQLKYLRSLNQLQDNEEPADGETLYLQENAPIKPALKTSVLAQNLPAQIGPEQTTVPGSTALSNPQATEPQVQFAANKEDNYISTKQSVEMGPAPAPETTVPVQPVAANETAGATLPPAPEQVAEAMDDEEPENTGSVNPPVNIANEKAVEEELAEEKANANEPLDEIDALKAKFDKVVYAQKTPVTAAPAPVPVVEEVTQAHQETVEQSVASSPGSKYYVVKKGDTAFGIAKRNNITVKELMEWNKLSFEGIKIGQKLQVKK